MVVLIIDVKFINMDIVYLKFRYDKDEVVYINCLMNK